MKFQGRDVMRLWDRFETVFVSASLDAMGARGEYLRKGQRWAQVLENRERMARDCPRAQFQIAPTVGVMNVLHLPDFHRDWIERGHIGPDALQLTPLIGPRHYNIRILPKPLKRRVAERYAEHVSWLERFGEGSREAAAQFRAVVEFMTAGDIPGELENFRERTRRLDLIRGERFAEVFPELSELV
jgi:hypothetical protein